MSGLVKGVKKVFNKIVKSPIFKAVAVAAIIWFTAGTAAAYFAAPSAGIGSAMASSATTMWTTTASFFGAEAAGAVSADTSLAGSIDAAVASGASANAANATVIMEGAAQGTEHAALQLQPAAGSVQAGSPTAMTYGGTTGMDAAATSSLAAAPAAPVTAAQTSQLALDTSGADLSMAGAPSNTTLAGGPITPPPVAKTGMMAWLADNPMATMMLGQGVMGAASSYETDKSAERLMDQEDEWRRNRGLMGFDDKGKGGVVRSQMGGDTVAEAVAEPGAVPATQAPTVAPQQVAAPVAPAPVAQQVPVPREQLPQMNQDGLIARG